MVIFDGLEAHCYDVAILPWKQTIWTGVSYFLEEIKKVLYSYDHSGREENPSYESLPEASFVALCVYRSDLV